MYTHTHTHVKVCLCFGAKPWKRFKVTEKSNKWKWCKVLLGHSVFDMLISLCTININSSTSFAFSGYRIPLSECKYVQWVNILHNHRFEQDGQLTLKREMCLSFVFREYLRSFKEQESKQQLVLVSRDKKWTIILHVLDIWLIIYLEPTCF